MGRRKKTKNKQTTGQTIIINLNAAIYLLNEISKMETESGDYFLFFEKGTYRRIRHSIAMTVVNKWVCMVQNRRGVHLFIISLSNLNKMKATLEYQLSFQSNIFLWFLRCYKGQVIEHFGSQHLSNMQTINKFYENKCRQPKNHNNNNNKIKITKKDNNKI